MYVCTYIYIYIWLNVYIYIYKQTYVYTYIYLNIAGFKHVSNLIDPIYMAFFGQTQSSASWKINRTTWQENTTTWNKPTGTFTGFNGDFFWLVVGPPLWKNMKVNWDDDIPNIWENKKWQPNHQPGIYSYYDSMGFDGTCTTFSILVPNLLRKPLQNKFTYSMKIHQSLASSECDHWACPVQYASCIWPRWW